MSDSTVGPPLRHDVSDVVEALHRYRQVFLHAGLLYQPGEACSSIREALESKGWTVSVTHVGRGLPATFEDGPACHILVGFDGICGETQTALTTLANTRAWAQRVLDRSEFTQVLVLSTVPKLRLLGGVGSQLVTDGQTCFLDRLDGEDVLAACGRGNTQPERRESLAAATCGLAGLITPLLESPLPVGTPKDAIEESKTRLAPILRQAVEDLGWEMAAFLDCLLFERGVRAVSKHESPLVLEALRGSGFVRVHTADEAEILSKHLHSELRDVVRDFCDGLVVPPAMLAEICMGLWEIERTVRSAVQRCAMDIHGSNWRVAGVPAGAVDDVLRKYRADTAMPITGIREVANPLEWLSWTQLLDCISSFDWCRPAGLPMTFWNRLRDELSPIRNRLAHFRVPRLGDVDAVRKWLGFLRTRLGESR